MTRFLRGLKYLLKVFLRRCVLLAQWTWSWIQYIAQILMPTRFGIVTIFLVSLLFLWSAPGKDLLLSLAFRKALLTSGVVLYFFVALFVWALCLWYWSRVMMRFVHDDFFAAEDDTERKKNRKVRLLRWFRKHIPRLMGLVPFIILFFAFPAAGRIYLDHVPELIRDNLSYLRWVSLGLGGLYYLIVFFRRRVFFSNHGPEQIKKHYAPHYKDWHDLGWTSFFILLATLSLSAVVFVAVWLNPQSATSLGTGSVLFLASASWVAFGSTLVSLGNGFRFPIISAALIGAVIIGPCTDNHQVRTLSEVSPGPSQITRSMTWDQRPTVVDDFEEWMASRSAVFNNDKEKIHPIFIVAAEGGGIRAAYWTANLLAAFQDANKEFADHVYALSGISGGSLGSAVFVNLLNKQKDLNCVDSSGGDWQDKMNRKCAHVILSEDFLTPTVASMLYPDMIQRINFLSFLHKFPDRAYALETTFEKAWEKHLGDDRFSRSFLESWDLQPVSGNKPKSRLPSLFLNSTWVEGGKRVIASNVQILREHFPDAEDLFSILCAEIPLSTAVHNSARFSYVSPAGTMVEPVLKNEPCRQLLVEVADEPDNKALRKRIKDSMKGEGITHRVWGHVVDGGYFENSGNTTAYDILSSIESAFKGGEDEGLVCGPEDQPKLQFKCIPVIITLINDPALSAASRDAPEDSADAHEGHLPQKAGHPAPDRWMTETLSPLKTLFQTRDGRGSYARDSTRKYVENRLGGLSLEFSLHDEKGALPLSWALSELVKDNIQKQADEVLVNLGKIKQEPGDPLNMEHLIHYRILSN